MFKITFSRKEGSQQDHVLGQAAIEKMFIEAETLRAELLKSVSCTGTALERTDEGFSITLKGIHVDDNETSNVLVNTVLAAYDELSRKNPQSVFTTQFNKKVSANLHGEKVGEIPESFTKKYSEIGGMFFAARKSNTAAASATSATTAATTMSHKHSPEFDLMALEMYRSHSSSGAQINAMNEHNRKIDERRNDEIELENLKNQATHLSSKLSDMHRASERAQREISDAEQVVERLKRDLSYATCSALSHPSGSVDSFASSFFGLADPSPSVRFSHQSMKHSAGKRGVGENNQKSQSEIQNELYSAERTLQRKKNDKSNRELLDDTPSELQQVNVRIRELESKLGLPSSVGNSAMGFGTQGFGAPGFGRNKFRF